MELTDRERALILDLIRTRESFHESMRKAIPTIPDQLRDDPNVQSFIDQQYEEELTLLGLKRKL